MQFGLLPGKDPWLWARSAYAARACGKCRVCVQHMPYAVGEVLFSCGEFAVCLFFLNFAYVRKMS